jgi:hypothetical protein
MRRVLRFLIRTRTSIPWPKPWSPTSMPPYASGCPSGRAARFPFASAGPAHQSFTSGYPGYRDLWTIRSSAGLPRTRATR